jgi:acetolactate synthase-1/2/3 large subunit
MKKDVKSAVADILRLEGVEYVFGYTGGHIMHMWEAANNAGIKLILNKQEGNGVFMADGYARITKKPSVVLGTAGPGVTNMVTGLANALLDSVPIIAIGATVETSAFGRNPVQDGSGRGSSTEQRLIFKASCKQAMLAPTPQAVPAMMREAFRLAISGRPGPVYVEIPSNFWNVEIDYESVGVSMYKNTHIPKCEENDCRIIAEHFYKAKHPFIIVGEGAEETGIEDVLMNFIDKVGVPFAVSPIAKNYVDEHHRLYLGVPRDEGKKQKIYDYMRASDFILFLGDRMQEWEVRWYDDTLVKNALLAQVDPDYSEIGRVYPVNYSAVGSISSFIKTTDLKTHSQAVVLKNEVEELVKLYPHKDIYPDGKGINPLNINTVVEKYVTKDAVLVCDTGYAKSMAIMKFRTKRPQRFIVADKYGPMGYSVPASLGARLATGKEVVCFVGDGGFQMTLQELGTAMNYDLKVIYIIENNGGCMSIVDFHNSKYGHHCADTFINPDFVKIAEGYGMKGYCVKTTDAFEKAFLEAQKEKTSVVIDARVDQSSMVWE